MLFVVYLKVQISNYSNNILKYNQKPDLTSILTNIADFTDTQILYFMFSKSKNLNQYFPFKTFSTSLQHICAYS